jgi:hypothetical protein
MPHSARMAEMIDQRGAPTHQSRGRCSAWMCSCLAVFTGTKGHPRPRRCFADRFRFELVVLAFFAVGTDEVVNQPNLAA